MKKGENNTKHRQLLWMLGRSDAVAGFEKAGYHVLCVEAIACW